MDLSHLSSKHCQSRINFVQKGVQTKTWTKIERTSMYKIEEIEKALNLLDTYDGQLSKTARALGINRIRR